MNSRRPRALLLAAAALLFTGFGQPIYAAELHGVLEARAPITLTAQASGMIVSIPVRNGQKVKAGQLLLRFDNRTAHALWQQAQAAAEDAAKQYERSVTMYERGLLSDRKFETATREHKETLARLRETEARLSYTEVRAPFSGVVEQTLVHLGETVNAELHAPKLMKLTPDKGFYSLTVTLPKETQAPATGTPWALTWQDKEVQATVVAHFPQIDGTGSVVWLEVPKVGGMGAGKMVTLSTGE